MKLKPLHDWAVIVPAEAAAKTAGGLYIPDSAKEKPEEGVVEAIGPGAFEEEKPGRKKTDEKKERKFIPTTVRPGDRVLYERWAGKTHTIDNQERVLVRERDILGLIERPLIPAVTASASPTAIIERPAGLPAQKTEPRVMATSLEKKPARKAAPEKGEKKAAKKTADKASAKPAKKAATKKAAKKSKAPGKKK